jgi:hypothetical protein
MVAARAQERTGYSDAVARASTLAPVAAAAGLALVGALLYHLTRDTTLWFDDWDFVLNRRGTGLATFLAPHGEHLSLVPVAIYKLLLSAFGIADYRPYRVAVIACHLASVALLFAYARRRVGDHLAGLAAVLMALFGPGWQNFLWGFSITYQLSLIGAAGVLLALDRRTRAGDLAACGLLALSLASSGIGVPVALGAAVDVALSSSWRRWWVVAVPLALYAVWWVAYQHAGIRSEDVYLTPGFVALGLASTAGALAGLGGNVVPSGAGTLIQWGAPLTVAALAVGGRRIRRLGAVPPRAVSLAAMLLGFWVIDGLSRADLTPAYSSRYLYVSALLGLLLAAELARAAHPGWPARVGLTVVVAAAAASNVGTLRAGAAFLRQEGQATGADLAALAIGRAYAQPRYLLRYLPGFPWVQVPAGSFFAAARAFGSPADSLAQLARANEPARELTDLELISLYRLAPVAAAPAGRRACLQLRGPRVLAAGGSPPNLVVAVPRGGLLVGGGGAPVKVALRRFGGRFQPVGSIAPDSFGLLRIPPDRSPTRWQADVQAGAGALVCRPGG